MSAPFAARGAPVAVLDVPDAVARDIYGYDLILVRPDMHVVWRGNAAPEDAARSRGGRDRALTLVASAQAACAQCPNGTKASAAPPSAQKTTTSHGGVFHMNSSRKAATPSAKSPALAMPDVHTGR